MALKVGETIPAGSLVLLTSGSYADFRVLGLFRAPQDVIVPGKRPEFSWREPGPVVDLETLSAALDEVPYVEAGNDD